MTQGSIAVRTMTKPLLTTSMRRRKPAVAFAIAGEEKKAPTMRKMEVMAREAEARTTQKMGK